MYIKKVIIMQMMNSFTRVSFLFSLPKILDLQVGKNGKLYSIERAYEVDKNAFITWRIFPVCATTPYGVVFVDVFVGITVGVVVGAGVVFVDVFVGITVGVIVVAGVTSGVIVVAGVTSGVIVVAGVTSGIIVVAGVTSGVVVVGTGVTSCVVDCPVHPLSSTINVKSPSPVIHFFSILILLFF
jgi:hypothetical protein